MNLKLANSLPWIFFLHMLLNVYLLAIFPPLYVFAVID
jgi:hypothetical protein